MTPTRSVLITGANAGIGRAAALQLLEAGHRVWLGCRDAARAEQALGALRAAVPGADARALHIDMASQASIRAAAAQVDACDVLIHNAASFDLRARQRTLTPDALETTWATNAVGPALLTELLLPRLRQSTDARVIAVTSKGLVTMPFLGVDLTDVGFERRRFSVPHAYYQSKLAHLAWMLSESERLAADRIRFHGVRVTNVKIDLARYPNLAWPLRAMYAVKSRFSITPDEMARTYTWLATAGAPGSESGGYWDAPTVRAPISRGARDPAVRAAIVARLRADAQLDADGRVS